MCRYEKNFSSQSRTKKNTLANGIVTARKANVRTWRERDGALEGGRMGILCIHVYVHIQGTET